MSHSIKLLLIGQLCKFHIITDKIRCVKMEGKASFSRYLQAVRNRDCWMFWNHWRTV